MTPFHFSSSLLKDIPLISHGFFTRKGGVSTGDYTSLNCKAAGTLLLQPDGSRVEIKDNPKNVKRNRDIIVEALTGRLWVGLRQKHTQCVHVIDETFLRTYPKEIPIGDGLVTTLPHIVLSVMTADCVPILLCDRKNAIIAVVHAGWKGAFDGVIENTIVCMKEKGATDIVAAIGPCIHQESYEVGPEFKDIFETWSKKQTKGSLTFTDFFKPKDGHFLFNLPCFVRTLLKECGVHHIDDVGQNTYTQPKLFFSYRYNTHHKIPVVGCQASSIMLR